MITDNLSTTGASADGAATQNHAFASGGLWKAGIAAAVVAGLALTCVGGWWLDTKRNTRSAHSSDGDTSSERARCEESGSHGKVQLWEDGPYWAETNIGAERPEDYGYYFWWGDTVAYERKNDAWVASDRSARKFSFKLTLGKRIDELKIEGWITEDGVLAPEHDAAHVYWGGDWRMPTKQELEDLEEKCDWTWTTKKGVEGYIVRGKGRYASASIFLPAAGCGDETSLDGAGSCGTYWSSVPDSDDGNSWLLFFGSSLHFTGNYYRDYGFPVRPVQGGAKSPSDEEKTTESASNYKKVGEDFVNALIKGDVDKAIQYVDTTAAKTEDISDIKEGLDKLSKEITDKTLTSKAVNLVKDDVGDGMRKVMVQFMKGKDKTPNGREIKLKKVDGTWKVVLGETLILNKGKKEMRKVIGFSDVVEYRTKE